MKNRKTLLTFILNLALWAANASAYEVWMGTHLVTHTMAITPSDWSMTASKLEGFNLNSTPHDTDPAQAGELKGIVARFTNAGSEMTEIARSSVTRIPDKVDELAFPYIDDALSASFARESTYGVNYDVLMFFDENSTYQGNTYGYRWTVTEVQHMRDWLNANGHADVKLMWDARNNSQANRNWALNSLVTRRQRTASKKAWRP